MHICCLGNSRMRGTHRPCLVLWRPPLAPHPPAPLGLTQPQQPAAGQQSRKPRVLPSPSLSGSLLPTPPGPPARKRRALISSRLSCGSKIGAAKMPVRGQSRGCGETARTGENSRKLCVRRKKRVGKGKRKRGPEKETRGGGCFL